MNGSNDRQKDQPLEGRGSWLSREVNEYLLPAFLILLPLLLTINWIAYQYLTVTPVPAAVVKTDIQRFTYILPDDVSFEDRRSVTTAVGEELTKPIEGITVVDISSGDVLRENQFVSPCWDSAEDEARGPLVFAVPLDRSSLLLAPEVGDCVTVLLRFDVDDVPAPPDDTAVIENATVLAVTNRDGESEILVAVRQTELSEIALHIIAGARYARLVHMSN